MIIGKLASTFYQNVAVLVLLLLIIQSIGNDIINNNNRTLKCKNDSSCLPITFI